MLLAELPDPVYLYEMSMLYNEPDWLMAALIP